MTPALLSLAFALLALPFTALAEDALVEGGRSPDGRYEVRLVRTPDYDPNKDGSEYSFQFHEGTKPLGTIGGSGFRAYPCAKEYCKALWDKSSRFVAITDRDSRHTNTLHLVAMSPGGIRLLEIPDYLQNALGRVNATSIDFACNSTPQRWEEDDLILQLGFTANERHSYTCEVTLYVRHDEDSAPSVGLKAVTQPEKGEG